MYEVARALTPPTIRMAGPARLGSWTAVLCLSGLAVHGQDVTEEPSRTPDPADVLVRPRLDFDESQKARGCFNKLADQDFDARAAALQALVSMGPGVFILAEEFARSENAEVARAAGSLKGRILLRYDGYVPEDALLKERLEQAVSIDEEDEQPAVLLQRLVKTHELPLYVDPEAQAEPHPALPGGNLPDTKFNGTILQTIKFLAGRSGQAALQRDGIILLTTLQRAAELNRQRHTFDWKALALDRDEAARVAEGLALFFPAGITELHGGSDALAVRGVPDCIPRAARLLALLKPGAPPAQWPAPSQGASPQAAMEALLRPASLSLSNDDPLLIVKDLGKQGHAILLVHQGKTHAEPPFPPEFHGLSPLSLTLRDLPLGLALRWFCARARFVTEREGECTLTAQADGAGRVRLAVALKDQETLALAVSGMDAAFLEPAQAQGMEPGQRDEAIRARLLAGLAPHLELFPEFNPDFGLRVLRGRALFQASPPAAAMALDLLKRWRADGKPPPCAWREQLEARLQRPVEWDGRGLTGGSLLRALRVLGNVTILLQASAAGDPPFFKLEKEDAALLPPGQHTLRALLDDLAAKAGASWEVRWGAISLAPGLKPRAPADPAKQPSGSKAEAQPKIPDEKPAIGTGSGF